MCIARRVKNKTITFFQTLDLKSKIRSFNYKKIKPGFEKSKTLTNNLLENLTLKTKKILVRETHYLLQAGIIMVVLVVLVSGTLADSSSRLALAKMPQQPVLPNSRALATLASAIDMLPVVDLSDEELPSEGSVTLQSTNDGYLVKPSVTTISISKKPRKWIIAYKVKGGDTLIKIASKFHISTNTVKWANGIKNADSIKVGKKLKILPVSGVYYKVKKGDTIAGIANKFRAKKSRIISFNNLKSRKLKIGQGLIIPGGRIKPKPKPRPVAVASSSNYSSNNSYNYNYSGNNWGNQVGDEWFFGYNGRGAFGGWYGGYCTSWVSLRRYIPWDGNASDWPWNARAMGYKLSNKPAVGAVYCEPGHVSYVEAVRNDYFLISEGNFNWKRGWARYRKVYGGGLFIH